MFIKVGDIMSELSKLTLQIDHYYKDDDHRTNSTYTFDIDEKTTYVVFLGINPSSKKGQLTDITNLKIINTVMKKNPFPNSTRGYHLLNFSSKIDPNSSSISNDDCTTEDIEFMKKKLIEYNNDHLCLCLFYGPSFMNDHKKVVRKIDKELQNYMIAGRLYCLEDNNGFCHPRSYTGMIKISKVVDIDSVVPPLPNRTSE